MEVIPYTEGETVYPPSAHVEPMRSAKAQRAIITHNQDPLKMNRVRVRYPWQGKTESADDLKASEDSTPWIRIALPMASNGSGFNFLPEVGDEAIINYVTLVGWSLDGSTEFFTREELEKCFTLSGIHKSPAVFDYKKLDWFNGQYIRAASDERIADLVTPYLQEAGFIHDPATEDEKALIARLVPPVKERMKVLSDAVPLSAFIFRDEPVMDRSVYVAKGSDEEKTVEALSRGSEILLAGLRSGREQAAIEEDLAALAGELGIKVNGVFQPIRVAITNSAVSLPLFDSIGLLGLDETERRLRRGLSILEEKQ